MLFFFIYLPILSPMLPSLVHSLNQKDPLSSQSLSRRAGRILQSLLCSSLKETRDTHTE